LPCLAKQRLCLASGTGKARLAESTAWRALPLPPARHGNGTSKAATKGKKNKN
jgi:hypothetical protein